MLGLGELQFTALTPGGQVWIAQTNSNFLALNNSNPWIRVLQSGEALALNDAVALNSAGKLIKADSNAAGRFNMFGVALNAAAGVDIDVRCQVMGVVDYTHAWTPGAPVYLSDTIGLLTNVAPAAARIVGLAMAANKVYLSCPSSWRAT